MRINEKYNFQLVLRNLNRFIFNKKVNPILCTIAIILYFVNMMMVEFTMYNLIGQTPTYSMIVDSTALDSISLTDTLNLVDKPNLDNDLATYNVVNNGDLDEEALHRFLNEVVKSNLSKRNEKIDFIVSFAGAAYNISKQNNVNFILLLTQACLESGFGSSQLSEYDNYFGIKYKKDKGMNLPNYMEYVDKKGKFISLNSKEYRKGEYKLERSKFMHFRSRWHGIDYYCKFLKYRINNPQINKIFKRYNLAFKGVDKNDWKENLIAIGKTGWSNSPTYSNTLTNIVNQFELHKVFK